MHMDGARLMNAVVASGVPALEFAAEFDTVWIDFSKGLGAPVGAVLAGTSDFIAEAWRVKHQLGGAMRQSGIIAAACLHALDHHVDRLADDHANARLLADGLAEIPGITVEPAETNMVFFDVAGTGMSAAAFAADLLAHGIRVSAGRGPTRLRAVTHLDVTRADVEETVATIRQMAAVNR
jgi:threonine aldolase